MLSLFAGFRSSERMPRLLGVVVYTLSQWALACARRGSAILLE